MADKTGFLVDSLGNYIEIIDATAREKNVKAINIYASMTDGVLGYRLEVTLNDGTRLKCNLPKFAEVSDILVTHDFDPTPTHTGDVDVSPAPDQAPVLGGYTMPSVGRLWLNTVTGKMFVLKEVGTGYFIWKPIGISTSESQIDHSEYFDITREGLLSLKPEYRGANTRTGYPYADSDNGAGVAGSKNAELPEYLVIPETVNGTAVDCLADGIFLYNSEIRDVVWPSCVDNIPERCFDNCANMHNLYNTEHIKSIGKTAFQGSSIYRAVFPALETLVDIAVFQGCGRLIYADVGKVTALPDKTFNQCASLSKVKSQKKVVTVGEKCFGLTGNLINLDFVSNLSNIGDLAFLPTRFDYDWNSLSECTFGKDSTNKQFNPTDFWSACSYTPCENPLPTQLTQDDPRWVDREIGSTGITYKDGCGLLTIAHAYCGLNNLSFSSIDEFESYINFMYPGHINTYTKAINDSDRFARGLGLTVDAYTEINGTVLQALYNALSEGKYATAFLIGTSLSLSHAVLVYGINAYGELLVLDTNARCRDDRTIPAHYAIPYKNLCGYKYSSYEGTEILRIISL